MRLANAAAYFDRTPCADAYGGVVQFKGQLNLFDDSTRDGTTVMRRVLSVADGVAIPARRVVTVHGEQYILGADHVDSFGGDVIRRKYVCHKAEGLAGVFTADQALRSLAGASMYAGRLWVKDMKEIETSSRLSAFVDVFVAPTETVALGAFVQLAGRWYLVRNALIGAAGLRVLECDELPEGCLGTAAYVTRAGSSYDAANDTVGGTTVSVPLLAHRWQDDFFYHRMSSSKFESGDVVARVSHASVAAPQAGDNFTFNTWHYRVVSVRDDGLNAWLLHSRRD